MILLGEAMICISKKWHNIVMADSTTNQVLLDSFSEMGISFQTLIVNQLEVELMIGPWENVRKACDILSSAQILGNYELDLSFSMPCGIIQSIIDCVVSTTASGSLLQPMVDEWCQTEDQVDEKSQLYHNILKDELYMQAVPSHAKVMSEYGMQCVQKSDEQTIKKTENPFAKVCTMPNQLSKRTTVNDLLSEGNGEKCSKVYKCLACKFKTLQPRALDVHVLRRHCELRHQCEKCSKKFSIAMDLARHARSHFTWHFCSYCSKKYKSRQSLMEHLKVHKLDSKPINRVYCNICKKAFMSKICLKKHQKIVHQKFNELQCKLCNVTFSSKRSYIDHQNIHTDSRPYKCTVCDKSFRQDNVLREHMVVHSDKSQFQCTICCRDFKHRMSFKRHMKTMHSKEKPSFPCQICFKSFSLKSHLNRHMNIHTNSRKYACPSCSNSFNDVSVLRKHMLNVHHFYNRSQPRYSTNPPLTGQEELAAIGIAKESAGTNPAGVSSAVSFQTVSVDSFYMDSNLSLPSLNYLDNSLSVTHPDNSSDLVTSCASDEEIHFENMFVEPS